MRSVKIRIPRGLRYHFCSSETMERSTYLTIEKVLSNVYIVFRSKLSINRYKSSSSILSAYISADKPFMSLELRGHQDDPKYHVTRCFTLSRSFFSSSLVTRHSNHNLCSFCIEPRHAIPVKYQLLFIASVSLPWFILHSRFRVVRR